MARIIAVVVTIRVVVAALVFILQMPLGLSVPMKPVLGRVVGQVVQARHLSKI